MTIFTQSDQALYKKLKSVFGCLIPSELELENFVAKNNLNWKDYDIELNIPSLQQFSVTFFSQSICNGIPKISQNSKHQDKEIPFCCFGKIDSTNALYFSYMVSLSCNNNFYSGIDSLKNMINYYFSQTKNPAIMIGIIKQDDVFEDSIKIKNLQALIPLIENYHFSPTPYAFVYLVIKNRMMYPIFYDYNITN